MPEQKKIKTADSIWVNTNPRVEKIGGKTEVGTLARMAAVSKMVMTNPLKYKSGDQVEWKITLEGLTTIDERLLQDARDQLLQ